jgi:hypothetical protein
VKTLAKLLYVEADEEITDLVDRLRDLSLEDEVTFVVPDRARALQSPMSFRLLKRYADSYGKRVNLVSADPRLQAMSLEAGFTAYPSMEAYDRGTQVHQPEPVDPAGPVTPSPAIAQAASELAGGTRSVATLDRPRQASVTSAPPKKAPTAPKPSSGPPLRSYRPYLIAAGVLVVLGLLAGILYLPTASATLFVSGTPIKEDITLRGAVGNVTAGDQFATKTVSASESQTLPGVATGQKAIPAVAATGEVVFTSSCLFCSQDLPKGLVVRTDSGKRYATQKAVSVGAFGGSATAPIAALNPGLDGNTDAHTITTIERGDPDLRVDNPKPTSGGADARTATVIQQSDIDSVKDAYSKDAIARVQDQLNSKAQGQTLVLVGKGVQATVTHDHNVGDEVSGFGVTVKVSGDGVVFDERAVKALLKAALQHKIPQGTQLTSNINLTYDAIDATPDGHVTLNGHEAGFYTPVFPEPEIKSNLKGKSIPAAREYFNRQWSTYIREVRINQQPFALPWLPFFTSRISLKIQEVASPSSS